MTTGPAFGVAPSISPEEMAIRKQIFPRPEPNVRFYTHAIRDNDASEAAGCPVYRELAYVEVRVPDREGRDYVSHAATAQHKREYPGAWAEYEKSKGKEPTRLQLLKCGPARYFELQERGIHSVEDLAQHPDDLPPNLSALRETAKRVLAALKPRYTVVDGQLVEPKA